MSALPHNKAGDKHELSNKRDKINFKFPTRVNIYALMGEL
jgi:hypothetical protein